MGSHESAAWLSAARLSLIAPVVIAISILIAYSNVPGNAFAFDDQHTIEQNPWIRSLSHIPRYFVDARTNSTIRDNMDYRPVLQTSYAVNYAMSGVTTSGFDSWHWTNILIHFANSWCVFVLGRRLMGSKASTPVPRLGGPTGDSVALAAAVLFAIHPTSAACVNYISGRSSSLTTLWVLLALIQYLAGLAEPGRWWLFVMSWVFAVLAVLTKIEGVSVLGAMVLAELFLNPAAKPTPFYRRVFAWRAWVRLIPFIITVAALIGLWKSRTGILNVTRSGADVTPLDYLVTQFHAWWYYLGKVFVPIHLIADYPTYPRSKWAEVIALRDWRPLAALASWLAVVVGALLAARRVPFVTFAVLCCFVFLAPHSSIVPLAEPVNEHRPYLPGVMVFLLVCAVFGAACSSLTRRPRLAVALAVVVLSVPLLGLTRQRNRVWRDVLSLWGDTVAKTPNSERAQANFGYALHTAGRYAEAERCYREAIRLAPGLHYAHTSLAQTLVQRGDPRGAMESFDTAVRLAPNSDIPYYWRGQFRAQIRDVAGAAADMEMAVKLGSAPLKELAGAAECLARLGRNADGNACIARGRAMDPAAFEGERELFRALLGATDPMEQVADGFAWLQKEQPMPAEGCFREALRLDPACIPAKISMGMLMQSLRNRTEAARWYDRAVAEHPNHSDPFHFRGMYFASLREWDRALADFRTAKSFGMSNIREIAAIAESLFAAGHMREAESELAGVDPVQAGELERERRMFRDELSKSR